MQKVIGIDAMDHIDLMTGIAQGMTQIIQVDRVAAETVWRVERGQVQKVERTTTFTQTPDYRVFRKVARAG